LKGTNSPKIHLNEVCRKPEVLFSGKISSPPVGVRLGDVGDDVALREGQLVRLLGGIIIASLKKLAMIC
jgi:hypothetical protein